MNPEFKASKMRDGASSRTAWSIAAMIGIVGLSASKALAQDSVATSPGGNDALSAYDLTVQRVRYVVDCVPLTSSWGNAFVIAPIVKASRDTDPMFRTQILGSLCASAGSIEDRSFPQQNYSLWAAAGHGVNAAFNTPAGTVAVGAFDNQFAVASADFSIGPTNIISATIGRQDANPARLFVQRDVLVCSRTSPVQSDLCTLSLGSVLPDGAAAIRADSFGTLPSTSERVREDNILIADPAARTAGLVGSLRWSGSTNVADDTGAFAFVLNAEPVPTNTPAVAVGATGGDRFALMFDFATRFRTGSTTANTTTSTSHLPAGVAGHRGNPSYTPLNPAGVVTGGGGLVASIAKPVAPGPINALVTFGLTPGSAGVPPTIAPGSSRAFVLPTALAAPDGFIGNAAGTAGFEQYLSQTSFRGGNGQVGIGQNTAGDLVLAAVASGPADAEFVAVVRTTGPSTSEWTIVGHAGQAVLDGALPGGSVIGTIDSPTPRFSAPAVDALGNVYFLAAWRPSGGGPTAETGLFKAVNLSGGGYQLERIVTTGQMFTGANSATAYTITALALRDADSIASGAMHSGQIIQAQTPGQTTNDPASARAFGGVVLAATISYARSGVEEEYDAVLFIGAAGTTPTCPGDFNGIGGVTVQDLFDFLAAFFGNDPAADFNHSGGITSQDLFDFLAAWFTPCP